eukprot:6176529-Pleurochrysis_carterae.AAC.8
MSDVAYHKVIIANQYQTTGSWKRKCRSLGLRSWRSCKPYCVAVRTGHGCLTPLSTFALLFRVVSVGVAQSQRYRLARRTPQTAT